MHFLIVVANFYQDLADELLEGAIIELEKQNCTYQKISVPGASEIPAVISFAADSDKYDGYIALGAVIKGETIHYEIVAKESCRGLNELAMNLNLAIGNGVVVAETYEQALARCKVNASNKGGFAAKTAQRMAVIRDNFAGFLNKNGER